MHDVLRPRRLSPGDLVVVAGLSGRLDGGDTGLLSRGVAVLERMGFRVRLAPLVDPTRRYWASAGSPAEQAAELNTLLRDPEVRAIVAHTGGASTFAYLDLVDLDAIRADPKPILGYSDISGLNLALHAMTGLVGFHADITTHGFGKDWYDLVDEERRTVLVDVYTRLMTGADPVGPLPAGTAWETWRPGRAEGRLIGGLLNRLVRLQSTPFGLEPSHFDGAVLFWEETRRATPAIWNDLHLLRLAGVFDRIAAMVVGIAQELPDGDGYPELREATLEALGDRPVPVLGHVDFGHAAPNLPLPLGIRAAVDADARTLTLLEPAVTAS